MCPRFITPIFLHAGLVHIALNMLAQLFLSAQVLLFFFSFPAPTLLLLKAHPQMEREMGSAGFFILYFAAGIFGNVLGANFALLGQPSTGASGAIFGTVRTYLTPCLRLFLIATLSR